MSAQPKSGTKSGLKQLSIKKSEGLSSILKSNNEDENVIVPTSIKETLIEEERFPKSSGLSKLRTKLSETFIPARNEIEDENGNTSILITGANVANNIDAVSRFWLLLRIILVLVVVYFILKWLGYLDRIVAWYNNTFGKYIDPILLKMGIKKQEKIDEKKEEKYLEDVGVAGLGNQINQPGVMASSTAGGMQIPGQGTPMPQMQQPQMALNQEPSPYPLPSYVKNMPAPPSPNPPKMSNDEALTAALAYAAENTPQPDDATSVTQIKGSKSGYCYIGEDRGFRSCIKVGPNDKCVSGQIYPSEVICQNPRLRP